MIPPSTPQTRQKRKGDPTPPSDALYHTYYYLATVTNSGILSPLLRKAYFHTCMHLIIAILLTIYRVPLPYILCYSFHFTNLRLIIKKPSYK